MPICEVSCRSSKGFYSRLGGLATSLSIPIPENVYIQISGIFFPQKKEACVSTTLTSEPAGTAKNAAIFAKAVYSTCLYLRLPEMCALIQPIHPPPGHGDANTIVSTIKIYYSVSFYEIS